MSNSASTFSQDFVTSVRVWSVTLPLNTWPKLSVSGSKEFVIQDRWTQSTVTGVSGME